MGSNSSSITKSFLASVILIVNLSPRHFDLEKAKDLTFPETVLKSVNSWEGVVKDLNNKNRPIGNARIRNLNLLFFIELK
jgi:hypothetical protein